MSAEIDTKTYSDDASLGKDAPALAGAEAIKGGAIDIAKDKVMVLYFFNTFYRGADICNNQFTELSAKLGDKVQFVAISDDADKEKTDKYLAENIVDLNTQKPLKLDPPHILFGNKKAVGKAYAEVSNLPVMSCPMGFIVKDGKIVWRQLFLQAFTLNESNFEAQLNHVLAGEELESNGPKPKVAVEEEEAEGVDGDFSLF
ncbi:hypothetical protein AGDE_01894 [Angomonas deanei]|uniref:Thioredoxin-like, putative n=1 Tax=Angomonas deanei TaxID=59799 RepID=S9WFA3_9TRYP|nr:hypothetical protein AGDE_11932 [Angomonas deanei]EPY34413.1 hypothetical protein AGDE_07928 [Angomonas deanei]EPY37856.1 hypothetical protein AGDE_06077 [Angomonas deanei]EPY38779.1 hypothetical protein AGDE_05150 [Angomonas deanei]EPY41485.1 hypothetical protein AGDE_02439 [Angomonas deanei]|eukprot:EPY25276.1 hypothetical protein AGDE_11932 [Angomonas deanei]